MPLPDWVLKHKAKGTHVIRRVDRYYLYKVHSVWDRKKGRAQLKTDKYLGRITPQGLVKPKHERVLERLRQASIKEYGASFLLHDVSKDIMEFLDADFSEGKEILVFAAMRLLHNTHIKNLEFHYETSFLSELLPEANLSDRVVGGMLREMGMDREAMVSFMKHFVTADEHVAIDLTHVFSLSEGVISSTLGYNSNGEYLPQVNVCYLLSLDTMMPSYFRVVVGSVGSVSSLKLTMKESGARDIVMVGDKGFYSAENVKELEAAGIHYILPLKRDSSLIDYGGMKRGDMRAFESFVFQGRPVWCQNMVREGRNLKLFFDRALSTEEERDFILRAEKLEGEEKAAQMEEFFERQHKMGTITVVTDLKEGGERIYELLKARIDVEQLYDTLKNTIHADRTYMRDDYQMQGWMFVNFVAMMLYYRIYNLLVSKKLLKKYSPMDVLEHLSRVQKVKMNGEWIMTEIPKKTRVIIEKLELPIMHGLGS